MKRRGVLVSLAVVIAAVTIIALTGRTPSRLWYEAELRRAADAVWERQNRAVERFQAGEYDRFSLSQERGVLVFLKGDEPQLVADVQFVGSYSSTSKTWLWAWANDSVNPRLARDSTRVKAFGHTRRLKKLQERQWSATESDGWEMATFQAYVVNAEAMYKTPFKQGTTYVTLKNIRLARPDEDYSFAHSN